MLKQYVWPENQVHRPALCFSWSSTPSIERFLKRTFYTRPLQRHMKDIAMESASHALKQLSFPDIYRCWRHIMNILYTHTQMSLQSPDGEPHFSELVTDDITDKVEVKLDMDGVQTQGWALNNARQLIPIKVKQHGTNKTWTRCSVLLYLSPSTFYQSQFCQSTNKCIMNVLGKHSAYPGLRELSYGQVTVHINLSKFT